MKLLDAGSPLAGLTSRFVRQSTKPLSRFGQGTTDLQIGVVDPKATLKLWDGVNHVLTTATADRAANMATYADPALPLAPGVAEDVEAFIRANERH